MPEKYIRIKRTGRGNVDFDVTTEKGTVLILGSTIFANAGNIITEAIKQAASIKNLSIQDVENLLKDPGSVVEFDDKEE